MKGARIAWKLYNMLDDRLYIRLGSLVAEGLQQRLLTTLVRHARQ